MSMQPPATAHVPRRHGRLGFPTYSWRVWVGWVALTALVTAIGGVVGFLLGTAADASAGQSIIVGIWICVPAATAGYFEFVNSRLRRSAGPTQKSEGLALAVAALGIGIALVLLGGPLVLVLAALAWRKIRKAGTPIAAGVPTAAVAFVVGALDTIYLVLVVTGVLP